MKFVWPQVFAEQRTQEPQVRRTVEPQTNPTQSWNGVAKMAITFEPMVRFGPNFARINIFQFHCHLKGKV